MRKSYFHRWPIYALILVILVAGGRQVTNAQVNYNHRFNPDTGLIHPVEKPSRDEVCLNGKWKFMPVFNDSSSTASIPQSFQWEKVPIKIPSPWNVNSFARGDGGDFITFPSYPQAWEKAQTGWMKRKFSLPEAWGSQRVILYFEAIAGHAMVYINGKKAGENLDIYFPFELDITDLIREGENEILVGVAKASLSDQPGDYGRRQYVAGSFWGQHIAGIWQDVYLLARPEIYIENVFVKPEVEKGLLSFEVTIANKSSKTAKISVSGTISKWINLAGKGINDAPVRQGKLGLQVFKVDQSSKVKIAPNGSTKITLQKTIDKELEFWTPDNPTLYGAVLQLKHGKSTIDTKYQRFGWRQFNIKGKELLLNGKPIQLKGDSWHFMGIPQMTRRYAWAWYKMLNDANANAVRLHAMPFPRFYLDLADEMGICVLDETGIWSSDGGPKIDSDIYWASCEEHVKRLVLRDRNHPSVFGWSVCNETIPVAMHVFHAPDSLVERQVQEINKWIAIAKKYDPTRDWISGDGETDRPTDLPTIVGHYGGEKSMKAWSSRDMPWGIGEQGMGYYGTPRQVSVRNGNRSYESQLGRMEGLAIEAYDLITTQRKLKASYASIFNLVWYGLMPLELGMRNTSVPPKPEDGIHFGKYIEGIPGVQPERLGPYCTTLNPGYDPNLPLYKPWPLFEAVQAAYAEPVQVFDRYKRAETKTSFTEVGNKKVLFLSPEDAPLKKRLDKLGVRFSERKEQNYERTLVIIDGTAPPTDGSAKSMIDKALKAGGTLLVWGVDELSQESLNAILHHPIQLTKRTASSFLKKKEDGFLQGLATKDFYFSESIEEDPMHYAIEGKFVEKGLVLLEASNTDWRRWNHQPEYLKTAAVLRSEREQKPEGTAIVKTSAGNGQVYVSSLDLDPLNAEGDLLLKHLLANLGVVYNSAHTLVTNAISEDGKLERALLCGTFEAYDMSLAEMGEKEFIDDDSITKPRLGERSNGKFWELAEADSDHIFDLKSLSLTGTKENAVAYLSFWVYSPRSLVNLLAEPDMPRLDMLIGSDDGYRVFLNGNKLSEDNEPGGLIKDEYVFERVPLDKGWNHFMIKTTQLRSQWKFSLRFDSDKPEFLGNLQSALEN